MGERIQYSVNPEAVARRVPLDFHRVLADMWDKHMGVNAKVMIVNHSHRLNFSMPDEFNDYYYQMSQITLAVEHLAQVGLIPTDPRIFDGSGRLQQDARADTLRNTLIDDAPLRGVRTAVIGGPEGRVFAEMGAEVLQFDPQIGNAPKIDLPNLEERAENFTHQIAGQNAARFDLTYTARVLDGGSCLVDYNGSDMQYVLEYAEYLQSIMHMTKPGGIGVHNGDMLRNIVGKCPDLAVREVANPNRGGSMDYTTIFVLQRAA